MSRLGERLVESGLCTKEAINQALSHQKITGHKLGDCLVELGLVPEAVLLRLLARELKTRFVTSEKLARAKIPPEVLDRVPVRLAEAQLFLPLALDRERKALTIVTADPRNIELFQEIALVAEMSQVSAYVGLRSAVIAGIKKHYYGDPSAFSHLEVGSQPGGEAPRLESGSWPSGTLEATVPRGTGSLRKQPAQLARALAGGRPGVSEADYLETLHILVSQLELSRAESWGHSTQLARQAATLARRMGLSTRKVTQTSVAAFLHELGKPKGRHLTLASIAARPEWKEEAQELSRAPLKLFESVRLPGEVTAILAQLYEAYDGSGAPLGARGDEIAAGARILSAVDGYLDLTRNPANGQGRLFSKEEASAYLEEQSGKLYDPAVVNLLTQLLSGKLLRRQLENEGRRVLVADPEEATRAELGAALENAGLWVQAEARLEGVADALQSGEAEVVVAGLRFGLPEIGELLQLARRRAESAGVPIVVLGEPPDSQEKEWLAQAAPSMVIPLPLKPEETAQAVLQLYRDRVTHGGPGRVVHGSYDELGPAELFRALGEGKKSGRLRVRTGTQEGFLHLEQGRAVYAYFLGQLGEPALGAMLALEHAELSYEPEAILLELPRMDRELSSFALP